MTAATTLSMKDRKDWIGAVRAMRRLLADPSDTVQVFRVMAALNGGTAARNYRRRRRADALRTIVSNSSTG